jgi:4-azaleucine resistance transporter AzlC
MPKQFICFSPAKGYNSPNLIMTNSTSTSTTIPTLSTSRLSEFFLGVRSELPLLLGVFPFGMIYGVLALQAGLSPLMAQSMSWVVFAGSAQFMITQLVSNGVPVVVIILTAFVINLRHALYSASLAPYLKRLSPAWKLLLSYLLTDEAYGVAITRYDRDDTSPLKHWFFLGCGVTLWAAWQISTALGIFLGAQISSAWALDFALPLTFIALVVPMLKDRAGLAAAVTGGVVSILAFGLPFKLGIIAAAFIGIAVGLWSERK